MKLLSISVAAYNVEKYLKKTLDSFLISDDVLKKIQVIVVNDGSTDKTKELAKEYVSKYPHTFKLIDKENGGYGSTINASLAVAEGRYFKTVDGDDWVDGKGLELFLNKIEDSDVDLIVSKFSTVSDYNGKIEQITNGLSYDNQRRCFDDFLKQNSPPFFTMHALTYKTELLKGINLRITENCFYTDKEYVMKSIPYVKTVMLVDTNVYMYRVGREGQSISLRSRMKHMDQAIYVNIGKCALMQNIILDNSISENKKQYLSDAIIHDVAIQYYFLLAYSDKSKILETEYLFDQDVKAMSEYVYEKVLSTHYGTIISYLRKKEFNKLGLKLFVYHLKLRVIDLRR